MQDGTDSNRSVLTEAERARLPGLTAAVLTGPAPAGVLLGILAELDTEQRPALAAAVFESVVWRADVRHYWVHFRMAKVYAALGPARDDAAFLMAAAAVQMQPDWDASNQPFRELFAVLQRRGEARAAVEVFLAAAELTPERPPAEPWAMAPLLRDTGLTLPGAEPAPPRPGSRLTHYVAGAEERPAWTCPAYGGALPAGLEPLGEAMARTSVEVAELPDAELLICNDATVVLDRDGTLHADLSVCAYPELVRRKFERLAARGEAIETRDAEDAVVIADRFPGPNLCHFLLDQITRLALYQRAGVDVAEALVIGPEVQAEFQRHILRLAGVAQTLGAGRLARVRAERLWVSSNCRGTRHQHAAHLGAPWAVEFARATLGGRGQHGQRRLYVSRGDVAARQVVNEDEVMALLAPHGFELIQPGRLPYEAQLAAFRGASHVIAPHGAALTHMIVMPAGAHVLEMFHPLYGTYAFALQAAAAGLRYAAMLARDFEFDTPAWNDPGVADARHDRYLARHMRVDLTALRHYLADVL